MLEGDLSLENEMETQSVMPDAYSLKSTGPYTFSGPQRLIDQTIWQGQSSWINHACGHKHVDFDHGQSCVKGETRSQARFAVLTIRFRQLLRLVVRVETTS